MYAKNWQQLALHLVEQSRRRYAIYEEDVRLWYRHGDGRPYDKGGKGHSYPYCIHGVSLWTDYDCACGRCEDGEGYWDYLRELGYARWEAKRRFDVHTRRIDTFVQIQNEIRNSLAPFTVDSTAINNWIMNPVEMK